jgi:hypothetical protein
MEAPKAGTNRPLPRDCSARVQEVVRDAVLLWLIAILQSPAVRNALEQESKRTFSSFSIVLTDGDSACMCRIASIVSPFARTPVTPPRWNSPANRNASASQSGYEGFHVHPVIKHV